jgi:hypothetical protein
VLLVLGGRPTSATADALVTQVARIMDEVMELSS